jgi:hypothetical protein
MKYLLYLGANERQLWVKDDQGWKQTDDKPDGHHVWVVGDFPEESLAEITTPRLFGRDRAAFIERQLASRFPDTPFRGALTPVDAGNLMERLAPTRQLLVGIDAAARLNAELDAEPMSYVGVWPISMLLADLGKRRELPPDLFIVFPGNGVLRIVFIKNRSPVLTRLTLTPNEAKAQVDEIVRTQRYLENNQIIPRDSGIAPVILLGDPEPWKSFADEQRISLVQENQWLKSPVTDWRFPLFDLALKLPLGQVAPMERRIGYLADRFGKAALMVAAVLLLAGAARTGSNFLTILQDTQEKHSVTASLDQVNAQIAEVDEAIAKFKVSPELVRRAVALDMHEIESVPAMERHWRLLAGILATDPALRIKELKWSIVAPGDTPCGMMAGAIPEADAPAPTEAPQRKIEMGFDLVVPDNYGPRDRGLTVRRVSGQLAENKELTVLRDALKDLSGASLQGGAQAGADRLNWCVSLPGQINNSGTPQSEITPR